VLGAQGPNVGIPKAVATIDLDLGTKELHVVINGTPPQLDTYLLPGNSNYIQYLSDLYMFVNAVRYNIHPETPGDNAEYANMVKPWRFLQCFIQQLSTGIKEPSRKTTGIKIQAGSKTTKIIIGPNGRIDRSGQIYTITGQAVNVPKGPGVYIYTK
jgi:hypothetical protein